MHVKQSSPCADPLVFCPSLDLSCTLSMCWSLARW